MSVVARQAGASIGPYVTAGGRSLEMLSVGTHTAEEMFQTAVSHNRVAMWIFRVLGTFLLFIALKLILGPVSSVARFMPIVGRLAGALTTLAALAAACGVALITISTAWLTYRPLIGVPILLLGLALFAFLVKRAVSNRRDAG